MTAPRPATTAAHAARMLESPPVDPLEFLETPLMQPAPSRATLERLATERLIKAAAVPPPPSPPPSPPIVASVPSPPARPSPRRWTWLVAGVAFGAAFALGASRRLTTTPTIRMANATPSLHVTDAVVSPTPTVSVQSLPTPVVEIDRSWVSWPASARGHRIFIDGVALPTEASATKVKCGHHTVQIGSNGAPHPVTFPCGRAFTLR